MDESPRFPDFDSLTPTTVAAVLYFNASVNFELLYSHISTVPVDPRLDDLKKRDKKAAFASFSKGLVLTVRYHDRVRGYPKPSNKKVWCGICQIMQTKNGNLEKVKTATTKYVIVDEELEEYVIKFTCANCKGTYTAKEMHVLDHFKNQIMLDVTSGHNTVNIMIFQGKMKIAGCNSEIEPLTLAGFVWHNYIKPISGGWALDPGETRLMMAMHTTMCNVNFSFGMEIDSDLLMAMWSRAEFAEDIMQVKASNPTQKNIKIRFVYDPASDEGVGHFLLTFLGDGPQVTISRVAEPPFKYTTKPGKVAKTTAIVFTSSATILSGRNMMVNRNRYEYFRQAVETYAEEIRAVVHDVDRKAIAALLN